MLACKTQSGTTQARETGAGRLRPFQSFLNGGAGLRLDDARVTAECDGKLGAGAACGDDAAGDRETTGAARRTNWIKGGPGGHIGGKPRVME